MNSGIVSFLSPIVLVQYVGYHNILKDVLTNIIEPIAFLSVYKSPLISLLLRFLFFSFFSLLSLLLLFLFLLLLLLPQWNSLTMVSATATVVCEWIFASVAVAFLAARLWVRLRVIKLGILPEDIILIAAQFFFFVWISLDAYTVSVGFMDDGANYLSKEPTSHVQGGVDEQIIVLKIIYASAQPYYLCIWLIKGAILGFYYRLIPKETKSRIFLHITTFLCIATLIIIILLNLFLCIPISKNWQLGAGDQQCYSSTARTPFTISAVANLVTDVFIFIVPFSIIPAMGTIPRAQFIGLITTFSLGIITMLVFVARAVISGISGEVTMGGILSAVECCTAMIVACLPALKVLLRVKKTGVVQKRGSQISDVDNLDRMHRRSMDSGSDSGPSAFMGLEHYEDRARHHHNMMMLATNSQGHEKSMSSYSMPGQSPTLSLSPSKTALRGHEETTEIMHPHEISDDDDDDGLDLEARYHMSENSYIDFPPAAATNGAKVQRSNLGRSRSISLQKQAQDGSVELDILHSHYQPHLRQQSLTKSVEQAGEVSGRSSINTMRLPTPNSQIGLLTESSSRLPMALPSLPPLPTSPPPAANGSGGSGVTNSSTLNNAAAGARPSIIGSAQLQQQIQQLQWQQEMLQQQQYMFQNLQQQQQQQMYQQQPLPAPPQTSVPLQLPGSVSAEAVRGYSSGGNSRLVQSSNDLSQQQQQQQQHQQQQLSDLNATQRQSISSLYSPSALMASSSSNNNHTNTSSNSNTSLPTHSSHNPSSSMTLKNTSSNSNTGMFYDTQFNQYPQQQQQESSQSNPFAPKYVLSEPLPKPDMP